MNFRTAQARDAARLAMLHADSWRRTYRGMMADEFLDGDAVSNRLHAWRERMGANRKGQFVFLAEHGSTLAGFICVFGDEDVLWGSYIDNLHVSSAYMRQGIGTALMSHAAQWLCGAHPRSGVYLWAMEANGPARRFYERLGASNAGTSSKLDPGGGSAPNCRYVWQHPRMLLRACQESHAVKAHAALPHAHDQ
jgi:GNAT superfamily N-acetyltransferase